jgi:hypothetical protein
MKRLFYLIFISFFALNACINKRDTNTQFKLFYFFKHTEQVVDSVSEKITYKTTNKVVTKYEIDILDSILKKRGWEHCITINNEILICDYTNNNSELILKSLVQLERELVSYGSKHPLH